MNHGYTQSNKKASMAAKMVTKYTLNGPGKTGGPGMKYKGNGKKGSSDKMKPRMTGSAKGSLAQKPKLANGSAHFSTGYSQHGKAN